MQQNSKLSPGSLRMIRFVDEIVLRIAKYWIALAATGLIIFIGLPLLAPILMNAGLVEPAGWIYSVYGLTCHQLAYRSYFLFGDQAAYTVGELQNHLHVDNPSLDLFFWRGFTGDAQAGYKVALCERDMAIYTTLLLLVLGYGIARRFRPIKSLPLRWFLIVFIPPIALDGLSQLFGFRESNPLFRTLTGSWFALGCAWLVLPVVDEAMRDLYAQTMRQLERVRARTN